MGKPRSHRPRSHHQNQSHAVQTACDLIISASARGSRSSIASARGLPAPARPSALIFEDRAGAEAARGLCLHLGGDCIRHAAEIERHKAESYAF